MAYPAVLDTPPAPWPGAATVDRQLDAVLPGWRDCFGDDLPAGLDLRPTVTRMRALLLMVQVQAAAGELRLAGMSPAQSVGAVCQWLREQLYQPDLASVPLPGPRPPAQPVAPSPPAHR
jgi:hypothetical protein